MILKGINEIKTFPNFIISEKQEILFKAIHKADVFPMRDYFNAEFAKKLFPFEMA
jgi:hypothetical protein